MLDHRNAVAAVARKFNTKVIRILLSEREDTKITEVVILAAAANSRNRKKVMMLFLDRGGRCPNYRRRGECSYGG
jgi:hypothetical protein